MGKHLLLRSFYSVILYGIVCYLLPCISGAAEGEKKTPEKGPKPYAEIITEKMISSEGLFTVHRDGDDVYFEIPASELGQDMLWVTQIAETQAGFSWAGMG